MIKTTTLSLSPSLAQEGPPAAASSILPAETENGVTSVAASILASPLTPATARRLPLPPAHPDTALYMRAYRARAALIRALQRADALFITYNDLSAPSPMADVDAVRAIVATLSQRIHSRTETLRGCARRGVLVCKTALTAL